MALEDLRAVFDQDAELYDRARPWYPAELVDDLAVLAEIGHGARVAEIGPGTGQATAALAARGAHVVGVELGPELAAVLRRELADASLEVVVSAFEDWPLPDEPFDTLAAFSMSVSSGSLADAPPGATCVADGGAAASSHSWTSRRSNSASSGWCSHTLALPYTRQRRHRDPNIAPGRRQDRQRPRRSIG